MALAFALLNAPFWWLGHSNFLTRPWLNVDLLIPLVLVGISPTFAVVSLIFFWSLDMAVSQSLTWHFHSPFEFIRSIEFVPTVNVGSYFSAGRLALVVPFLICAYSAFLLVRRTRSSWLSAVLILFVVALIDIGNGSSFLWPTATRMLPGNVAGSAVKVSFTSMISSGNESLEPLPVGASLTSKVDVLTWAKSHPGRSVLLVLVESMGLHSNPDMRSWLRGNLVDQRIASRFHVDEYAIPFRGSTTSAELRELCGISGNYRNLKSENTSGCLPRQLSALGWHTVGLHGFSHRMFMRGEWWHSVGLEHTLFAEQLTAAGQTLCGGAFVGICDGDVLGRAVTETGRPRSFVYVVTLNSHLPLGEDAKPSLELSRTCKLAQVGSDVCALSAVLGTGMYGLRMALLAATGDAPLVLVVGDHAPPFSDISSRKQFDQTMVPAYVLTPLQ